MDIRKAISAVTLTVAVCSATVAVADTKARAASHEPDIITIVVDDHGYLPSERVLKRLPNIRKLFLDGGMRLSQMYNETPQCSPARANLLTGQHTLTNGVHTNDPSALDDSRTVATALHQAGYHTVLAGRYLVGYNGSNVPPGWDKALIRKSHRLGAPSFWLNGELTTHRGSFADKVLKTQAVKWVSSAPADVPLFLMAAPLAPHGYQRNCRPGDMKCLHLPAVMKQDWGASACSDVGRFKPPNYFVLAGRRELPMDMPPWPGGWPLRRACESLLVVDRMVGELVAAQQKRGRPAYFIFMSDNGMSWGQKSFPQKHVPTSTRLPFYVSGPGISPGSARTSLLSIIDVPVTIADMAGAEMPWADGMSFLSLLKGNGFGGRDSNLELSFKFKGERNYLKWRAIRTEDWYYIEWETGKRELYAYRSDPWMRNDRSKTQRGVVAARRAELIELMAATIKHPRYG